jgi:hypothetical protein
MQKAAASVAALLLLITLRLRSWYSFRTISTKLLSFLGISRAVTDEYSFFMKTFTLTLYARRKNDGTYDYSLNVWQNHGTGTPAPEVSFESEALLSQQVSAVLPNGRDASHILPQAPREGDYWFPFTMPMSEAQAANLGWLAEKPLPRNLVH